MGTSRRKLGTALVALGAGCLVGMAGSWLDLQLSQHLQPVPLAAQAACDHAPCSPRAAFGQALRIDALGNTSDSASADQLGAVTGGTEPDSQVMSAPGAHLAKRSRLVRSRGWPLLVGEAIDPWEDGAVALASAQFRRRTVRSSSREVSWAYRRDVVDPWAGPTLR
ncbi:MAG TPA: hypothetical protein VFQ61_29325 [Polyangiaceae bacterium]|nr:hypothetical protein [Polyangiaceae bacterium]